jgi:hypothetical protein
MMQRAIHERSGYWRRRELLAAGAATGLLACGAVPRLLADDAAGSAGDLHIATFRFDATPPVGHSLCGGWIKPAAAVDDPLEAIGLVLLGAGKPIVLCAVDWTGICNSAHVAWRTALAEAAGTSPERVAVQCVHQHNAPFVCFDAEKLVAAAGDLPHIVDLDFHRRVLEQARKAIADAVRKAEPLTHIAHGQGRVERVASNRRMLGDDGKVKHWRGSASRDPLHKELPEGLIDPWLKTVAFYSGERKLAACHYYATHPMSFYGDGRVSSDFVGLARKRRQKDEPDCTHIYFTGAAGNVAAGKYNDGSPQARVELTDRVYAGIVGSEAKLVREPIASFAWRTHDVLPPPNEAFAPAALAEQIAARDRAVVARNRPAYTLAYRQRFEAKTPIVLSALHVNDIRLLHLPAESFIEYQLAAQKTSPEQFVATAAYGDGGPWYIPTADAYPQGGYEVSVAFCDAGIEKILREGISKLLSASEKP